MKLRMHGRYLKAKKRNISSDDIKRSLTYVNGVQVLGGGTTPPQLLENAQEDPYQDMHYMVLS